jgi:hypothetical protein
MNDENIDKNINRNNEKIYLYNDFIEFKYLKKNKAKIIDDKINDFLFNNKLLGLASVENCSKLCFGSMNISILTNSEQICMIDCFNKYSDIVLIGEKIYDGILKDKFRKTLLIKGEFEKFQEDVKNKLFT